MEKGKFIFRKKLDAESVFYEWASFEGITDDEIFIKKINGENFQTTIFIVDCFYLRINSTLSLTVIVHETDFETTVDIISSGGTTGLLGISYGAEKSAVDRFIQFFKDKGIIE